MSKIDIPSSVAGAVWQIPARPGSRVAAGEIIVILESMKLEIEVTAPRSGILHLHVTEGQVVASGDVIATLEAE